MTSLKEFLFASRFTVIDIFALDVISGMPMKFAEIGRTAADRAVLRTVGRFGVAVSYFACETAARALLENRGFLPANSRSLTFHKSTDEK